MRLLLHALTTTEARVDLPAGLCGSPLVRVELDGMAAWATRFDDAGAKFGRAELLEEHQIVSRLHAQCEACLPARFPTWFSDETALHRDLVRRQAELRAALDAVHGRCEVAVTVLWTEPTERDTTTTRRAATPGTRYLRERQRAFAGADRRRERARELADVIERAAGADLVAVRRQVCPSATVALSSALLAPRGQAAELINRLPRTQGGVRILVNGPWPPYTFAGITGPQA